MNLFLSPMVACGGGGVPMIFVYAFYGTAALAIGSFVWGAVSLFSGAMKLGMALVSFAACLTFLLLKFFGFV